MKIIFFILLAVFGPTLSPKHYATCTTFQCVENHKNQEGQIQGILRAYTPNESGKGAGHMFWDYEILLSDSIAIPVVSKPDFQLDFKEFLGKKVMMKCTFYYGVVIGGTNPEAQAATGWRIDAESIVILK